MWCGGFVKAKDSYGSLKLKDGKDFFHLAFHDDCFDVHDISSLNTIWDFNPYVHKRGHAN
jgi:hypothetical protein